jgi:hypothetical protein
MSLDRVLGMDIEWILYHVVHNSPDFTDLYLDVDFYNDDVWSRLLASLHRNSTISNVKIERHQDGEGERTPGEMESLCSILSRIPSIESLIISAATIEDFGAAAPLLRHKNLRHCHLDWSGIDAEDNFFLSSQVGQALADAPTLKDLVLEDPPVDGCSLLLVPILRSKSLRSIKLQSYGASALRPDDARSIFQALRINPSLVHFSLGYLLDADAHCFVPETIRQLQGLKELQLTMAVKEDMGDLLRPLIEALGENQTLTFFENCSADATMVTPDIELLQIDMLKKNTTLEYLSIFKDPSDLRKYKTMFLQLNSAGRKNLFCGNRCGQETAPPQDWLNVMGGACENIDCLYYCLSMNPSLCKMVQCTGIAVGKRKR